MSIATLIICLLLSFLFSGLEAAVLAASMLRARHQASASNNPRAARIDSMLGHRDRLLAAVSVANGAAGLGAFAIVTLALVRIAGDVGYAWAFALWLPVYLFAFELVPKALFRRFPYRMLQTFAPLLTAVDATLGRVLYALSPLRHLLRREDSERDDDDGREAFRNLADTAGRHGALTDAESDLIHSVLDFQKLTVADVMIPRERVTTVPLDMPADGWLEIARTQHLDHLPTVNRGGEITGMLDVLAVLSDGQPASECPASQFATPVPDFPAEMRAVEALALLRRSENHAGRVIAAPGTLGIVVAEDILHGLFLLHGPSSAAPK